MADRTPPPRSADLLAAYELGLLDADDRVRVENALAEQPDLLDDLYDAAPETQLLLADPGRFAGAARAALDTPPRWRTWLDTLSRPRVLAPVALAAALAAVMLWPDGAPRYLTELADPRPLPAIQLELRSGAAEADAGYHQAMAAYIDGRWHEAAAGFATALAAAEPAWGHRDQAHLYAGSSLLLAERPLDALASLQAAAASPLPPVREQARWQLAQAHLLMGQADAAREHLDALRGSPVFGDRVTDLLDTLGSAP